MNARAVASSVLGLALALALGLLAQVTTGGELAAGCAVVVLLLGGLTQGNDRRGLGWDLARVLGPALAGAVALLGLLELAVSPTPPSELAWFARTLGLVSAGLLFRTPPAALVLHGLVVVLVLWTSSALSTEVNPGVGAATVLTLAVSAYGLLLARSCEQRSAADGSLTVGVAPTPLGLRQRWLPVLAVVVLTLVPFGLGLRLPRPGPGTPASAGGSATVPQPEVDRAAPSSRRVQFTTELRIDLGHKGLDRPNQRVAEVRVRPDQPVLFLRGAALTRLTEEGFFPPERELPEPSLPPNPRVMTLDVRLLREQGGYLFTEGTPLGFDVPTRSRPEGVMAAEGATYPLRYQARCALPGQTVDPRDLQPLRDPALLALPDSVGKDPRLVRLANQVAWSPSAHLRATAIMRWLAANTRYDGDHPVRGADLRGALQAFLFDDQRGICVEFATAAAVLLRLADVPARVVTGYRTHERDGDVFVVRARHAHAWVEVAYDGAGWVPYDPTPGYTADAAPSAPVGPAPTRGGSGTGPGPGGGGLLALGWPLWALNVGLGLLLVLAVGLYAFSRHNLQRAVRMAQLARSAPEASAELKGDRARFFELLAARGFDLEGARTPTEWLALYSAVLPAEPELTAAISHYTALRFSGREPAHQVEAFRRSLRALPRRPAAARRNQPS